MYFILLSLLLIRFQLPWRICHISSHSPDTCSLWSIPPHPSPNTFDFLCFFGLSLFLLVIISRVFSVFLYVQNNLIFSFQLSSGLFQIWLRVHQVWFCCFILHLSKMHACVCACVPPYLFVSVQELPVVDSPARWILPARFWSSRSTARNEGTITWLGPLHFYQLKFNSKSRIVY